MLLGMSKPKFLEVLKAQLKTPKTARHQTLSRQLRNTLWKCDSTQTKALFAVCKLLLSVIVLDSTDLPTSKDISLGLWMRGWIKS